MKNYDHHDLAHLARTAQVDIAFALVLGLIAQVMLAAWLS